MKSIIAGFFFIILLVSAIWLASLGVKQGLAAQASTSWPSVEGTIRYSEFEYSGSGSSSQRRPVVQYSYAVEGKTYESDRIAFGPVPSDKGGEAVSQHDRASRIKAFALLTEGSPITVYYRSDDPSISVLLPGGGLFVFLYLFGASLMLAFSAICFGIASGRIRT